MINLISLLLKDINFFICPDVVELDNIDDVTIIDMLTTSLLTCFTLRSSPNFTSVIKPI